MDLADGHIILVAEACQALDMQLLVVSFPSLKRNHIWFGKLTRYDLRDTITVFGVSQLALLANLEIENYCKCSEGSRSST